MAKRALDVVAAGVGLVVLSPVLALVALAILVTSGRPVIYAGERVGKDFQRFRMWKFRTMVRDAEASGVTSTASDDPRITRVGRVLRRSKLDELPQLLNVLRGEMSLVGPRPEVPEFADMLTGDERAVLSVRPGITDLASLWDVDEGAILAGQPDPDEAYLRLIRPGKVALQLQYVHERSMWLDLKILARTLAAVFRLWVDRGYGRTRTD